MCFTGDKAKGEPAAFCCVFFQGETGRWMKADERDLVVPIFQKEIASPLNDARLKQNAEAIIRAEMEYPSWTLMHRFNLCHDLAGRTLQRRSGGPRALLRVAALQRHSGSSTGSAATTRNRSELSHSQDRLTQRLAETIWRRFHAVARCWIAADADDPRPRRRRAAGPRRDPPYHAPQSHRLKEVRGTFIEEWHQKLHNNTTPDDVVICEAYLVFLRSNGDLTKFNATLEAGGVTRQRLASFERKITTEPALFKDKKDALIGEFDNFLRILKAVHLGTDLESAIHAAKSHLDGGTVTALWAVHNADRGQSAQRRVEAIVAVRETVQDRLRNAGSDAAARELLYLDLALESKLRGVIESLSLSQMTLPELLPYLGAVLKGLANAGLQREFELTAKHWAKLPTPADRAAVTRDWALHARAVVERANRAVGTHADEVGRSLQPLAEFLGAAFHAEKWVVDLFSEEVVRAGATFPFSLVAHRIEALLREAAGIGGWQVVSPHNARGKVVVVNALLDVQEASYSEPTVLVASRVTGNEEIPNGVKAVLTPDAPDLVSHVAVRARNAAVLFASCFEAPIFEELKQLAGRWIQLEVNAGGDVAFSETTAGPSRPHSEILRKSVPLIAPPENAPWVILPAQFTRALAGGKSNNLNGLRGKVPESIQFPPSMTLPFGTFERVLNAPVNRELKGAYEALLASAEHEPLTFLPRVRELIVKLHATLELKDAVNEAWGSANLPPLEWDEAWYGITRVWASKWTDRAFFSRRSRHVPHANLLMAVLVQQVVEADYAFVIHTVNPINGNKNEVFAEVVCGLGETLVGNYPGRSFGFVFNKTDHSIHLHSYPGKTEGLFGSGVIFRSDSNGEDLQGFAGAGLYDSVLAREPETRVLDYSSEPLVWDALKRNEVFGAIAQIGIAVENALGSPQDIEGAVSRGRYFVVQTRPQVGL